jgi:hypothetical protein
MPDITAAEVAHMYTDNSDRMTRIEQRLNEHDKGLNRALEILGRIDERTEKHAETDKRLEDRIDNQQLEINALNRSTNQAKGFALVIPFVFSSLEFIWTKVSGR